MKQRPPATDLSGLKTSAESLIPRRINLAVAVADAGDFRFDSSFAEALNPTSLVESRSFGVVPMWCEKNSEKVKITKFAYHQAAH